MKLLSRLMTFTALPALVALACWTGCNSSEPARVVATSGQQAGAASGGEGNEPQKRGTVGVSVLTLTNPFFGVIGEHIRQELAPHGYDTVVVSGEWDIARQQQQVRDFITAGHVAIVLCPVDSKGIGPVIREANAAGIPVFTADIASLAEGAEVVSHIATDNYGGGKQAAVAMIEALGETGGEVVILDFKAAESCILRVNGFKEVIDEHNRGRESGQIKIVAELPGDGKKETGDKAAEDALQAHPNLAGIFAINDPSALGARAALEKAGKADQVVIVGFDGQRDGKEAIRDGKIYADPIQHPDQIGTMTAQSILKYFAGEEVPSEQLIPTGLYRQADALADPELK